MASEQPKWARCKRDDCNGVRLSTAAWCLAHAAEQAAAAFDAELNRLGAEGTVDARGVVIRAELLQRLLAAAPRKDERATFKAARFDQAIFQDLAGFGGASFEGEVRFDRATFQGEARFDRATFKGRAGFGGASFQGRTRFDRATFQDLAGFGGASFQGRTRFDQASFKGRTWFRGATFQGEARFDRASFQGRAWFDRATFKGRAGFDRATFQDQAWFEGVSFQDQAGFGGAGFQRGAWFEGASFQDQAWFRGATFRDWAGFATVTFQDRAGFGRASFQGDTWFDRASFESWAGFGEASFEGWAGFEGATFQGEAGFDGTIFQRKSRFNRVTFQGGASFEGATFQDQAEFAGATFRGHAGFAGTTFQRKARFHDAAFEEAREFGPVLARRELIFDGATFKQRVQIEAAASTLCASRARFLAGVQLRLRWAQVVLDDADLAAPSILVGAPPFTGLDEDHFARTWRRLPPSEARDGRPRLLSVRRADLAGLSVDNADLRACRFLGAHNLDKLRVEGDASLGSTPGPWRWTTRQTIAEEHHWRSSQTAATGAPPPFGSPTGWYSGPYQQPDWLEVEEVTPAQIATLYRARRKSREDNKDEPGAADFYYGEMEMRRHARHQKAIESRRQGDWGAWASARVEYAILWLYWLVSGYALRAWRAFAALAAILTVFAVLCAYGGGFAPQVAPETANTSPPTTLAHRPGATVVGAPTTVRTDAPAITSTVDTSFGGALVYGARTAVGLAHNPQPQLSRRGDVLQILLRILAPVLLALAILSVRGRVKR